MILNKIQRWWQGRGFGIESKTDHAFLPNVIREKLPYYAYNQWQQLFPDADNNDMYLAKLLFRISNNHQPATIHLHGNVTALALHAVSDGCRKASVKTADTPYIRLSDYGISAKIEHGMMVEYVSHTSSQDVPVAIVLTEIEDANRVLWQRLLEIPAITYDIQDICVLLIRKGRYPEHYKINR